jgi:outer membrane protein assembly factor BamB
VSACVLDIVVGGSWKVDALCLARLYAYDDKNEPFDFSPILDIIDIVVDGINITSKLPEESIFCVMFELVTGLSLICEGRIEKHIVAFQEAPWEFAMQSSDGGFELSFYGIGPPRDVPIHNACVDARNLLDVVCVATEQLLDDLVEVNGAFARAGVVRSLRAKLERLQTVGERAYPAPKRDRQVPANIERAHFSRGDRRLMIELEFDASHPDLWRYQGAPDSDLHSLLFTGTLGLRYWGRHRRLTDTTYLFPVVEGLVSGAERLLKRLEQGSGGCVILDGSDGASSLVTADVLDADRILLRVSEVSGSVGRTHTTPDRLFAVLLDTAKGVIESIVELNPRQELNERVIALSKWIQRIRGQFEDIRRGDRYFDGVESYLRVAPTVEPSCEPIEDNGEMPFPLADLRHVFLRSTWYLPRRHMQLNGIRSLDGRLLVPSHSQLDLLDRRSGEVLWSIDADRLLAFTKRMVLVGRRAGLVACDMATGRQIWSMRTGASPADAVVYFINSTPTATVDLSGTRIETIDLARGRSLWSFELAHGELVGLVVAGPVLVIVSDDGFAYGLRPDDGELLWNVRTAGSGALKPMYHDGSLFLSADWDPGCDGVIYRINPLTGRRDYRRIVPAALSCAPLLTDGLGVLALERPSSALIVGIDLDDGQVIWSQAFEAARIDAPSLSYDPVSDHVLVKSDTGRLMALDRATGTQQWQLNLLEPGDILLTNVAPVIINDHLVVPERFVSIVDLKTGRRMHRFDQLPEHPAYLHVDGEMRMILGGTPDYLECFDLSGFLALV